jgi:hypothetical protein
MRKEKCLHKILLVSLLNSKEKLCSTLGKAFPRTQRVCGSPECVARDDLTQWLNRNAIWWSNISWKDLLGILFRFLLRQNEKHCSLSREMFSFWYHVAHMFLLPCNIVFTPVRQRTLINILICVFHLAYFEPQCEGKIAYTFSGLMARGLNIFQHP